MGQGRQAINMNSLHNIYHHWFNKRETFVTMQSCIIIQVENYAREQGE